MSRPRTSPGKKACTSPRGDFTESLCSAECRRTTSRSDRQSPISRAASGSSWLYSRFWVMVCASIGGLKSIRRAKDSAKEVRVVTGWLPGAGSQAFEQQGAADYHAPSAEITSHLANSTGCSVRTAGDMGLSPHVAYESALTQVGGEHGLLMESPTILGEHKKGKKGRKCALRPEPKIDGSVSELRPVYASCDDRQCRQANGLRSRSISIHERRRDRYRNRTSLRNIKLTRIVPAL